MAEIYLARRSRRNSQDTVACETRSEIGIWLVFMSGLMIAFVFKYLQWLPLPLPYLPRQGIAYLLTAAGLGMRYAAVTVLGGFFTTRIQILGNHQIIKTGPYRIIRHPAYCGILLAFTGIGIAFGDLLALLTLIIPSFFAVNSRISLEEQWLTTTFGDRYRNYCQHTRKLIPWLY